MVGRSFRVEVQCLGFLTGGSLTAVFSGSWYIMMSQIVEAFQTAAPCLSSFRVLLRLLSLSCIIHESPGGAGGGDNGGGGGGLSARDICLQPSHSEAQSSPT